MLSKECRELWLRNISCADLDDKKAEYTRVWSHLQSAGSIIQMAVIIPSETSYKPLNRNKSKLKYVLSEYPNDILLMSKKRISRLLFVLLSFPVRGQDPHVYLLISADK